MTPSKTPTPATTASYGTACADGATGRVLPERHTDTCADPYCQGCQPCPDPHCQVCRRHHAQHTCALCLGMVRANLRELGRLAGNLHDEAQQGRKAHHVGTGVPGGDALVLASPGADMHGYAAQLAHRRANGLDVSHTLAEVSGDPTPPLALLVRWEPMWREVGLRLPDLDGLTQVLAWLDDKLHLVAHSGAFPRFAREVAAGVRQLEDVTHDGDRVERSRVPCLTCGVRLVKTYGDTEAEDHHRCPGCGERYDPGRFQRAKHQHLASQGADRYVSVADAVAAVGRPEQTVRAWMRRGLVAYARDTDSGRVIVWWPDVREQHLLTKERKRTRDAR